MAPVAKTRSRATRIALVAIAAIALLIGVGALYVLLNAEEAKAVQATAGAGSICKRALSAGTNVTCPELVKGRPLDPWGRDYLCEIDQTRHVRITSLGRDGRAHGVGPDADVACESTTIGNQMHCACRIITGRR